MEASLKKHSFADISISLEKCLQDATRAVIDGMSKDVTLELRHYNESVFRYLLIKQFNSLSVDGIQIWDEWHRIDLLLRYTIEDTTAYYPIELKFYDHRPQFNFTSNKVKLKGGPSDKNFSEFVHSIETLKNDSVIQTKDPDVFRKIGGRYLILVYIDPKDTSSMDSGNDLARSNRFSSYYKHDILVNLLKGKAIEYSLIGKNEDVAIQGSAVSWIILKV